MAFDSKCYDLAAYFLPDASETTRRQLAESINQGIESFLACERMALEHRKQPDLSKLLHDGCCCVRCYDERRRAFEIAGPSTLGWRYACEICGNKRCPHHADHRFVCTGSNEVGQVGILMEGSDAV